MSTIAKSLRKLSDDDIRAKCLRKLSDDDIRRTMREYEWATDDRVIEAALTIVRATLTQPSRPLSDILLELALNSLVFVYDRELLIWTKQRISREWTEIDKPFLGKVNGSIRKARKNGIYPPKKRLDRQKNPLLYGLSLVVAFRYRKDLENAMRAHLRPIPSKYQHRTFYNHFTVLNIGTEIPPSEVDRIRSLVRDRISGRILNDYRLKASLGEAFDELCIRPEIRLMSDGSLVLFGSGFFLEAMYELKLKLREDLFSLDMNFDPNRDRQPVWIYSVFARIGKPLTKTVVEAMTKSYARFQRTCPISRPRRLLQPTLGLLTFGDHKAILEPVSFQPLFPLRPSRIGKEPSKRNKP